MVAVVSILTVYGNENNAAVATKPVNQCSPASGACEYVLARIPSMKLQRAAPLHFPGMNLRRALPATRLIYLRRKILRLKSGAKLRLQSILLRRVHRLDSRVRDENKKRTSSQWRSRVGAAQSEIMMMPANSPWMSERARGVARRAGHDRHEVRLRHGALRRPTVHLDGVATRSCITYIESIGTSEVTTIEAIGLPLHFRPQ
jgi:hypothetical protein